MSGGIGPFLIMLGVAAIAILPLVNDMNREEDISKEVIELKKEVNALLREIRGLREEIRELKRELTER